MAQSRTFIMRVVVIALILFATMAAFETAKQLLNPDITIWQSHIVTIVFTTVTGTIVCYFVFRKIDSLYVELEQRVEARTAELETSNRQLGSFAYSVAHDLRTPLRAINAFSVMVLKANEGVLDQASVDHLKRIVAGSERMGALIDDLLNMTRLSRQELRRSKINLSQLATTVVAALAAAHPQRSVQVTIQPDMHADGDPGLMALVLENLIGNAWKFTSKTSAPKIEVGSEQRDGHTVYRVRDNGAGFDMAYAHKLFTPFQRLHQADEFEGTGIGLATVDTIIQRHGGKIWLESDINAGATAFYTIGTSS